ncbi:hypothetical protein [Stigmatella aurantiaca]|uniref:Uncharacterized protein n=1 Tax=Stigmatella aurantiaca (strain DW4/3-1) TaxID=378806 RepID=Q08PR8_STIAD|nr:hypothetical protein [Stigmatella aurantiaca]EAU62474.1 hypothetical protein STIAU_3550 [Stigmatella aurantiaca DW4/3-1]
MEERRDQRAAGGTNPPTFDLAHELGREDALIAAITQALAA